MNSDSCGMKMESVNRSHSFLGASKMSDLDDENFSDLDEEELERQLAELGSDIGSDDLEDLSGLDDEEEEAMSEEEEFPPFDEDAKREEVEEEVRQLVDGLAADEMVQLLRKQLVEWIIKKEDTAQRADKTEEEYFSLKEAALDNKDPHLRQLEAKVDHLNDQLEEEEREAASMYIIFKEAERSLVTLRDEHSRLQKLHEQREAQQNQALDKLRESMNNSLTLCGNHKQAFIQKINDLTDSVEEHKNELQQLRDDCRSMELDYEEQLDQRKEKLQLVASATDDVTQHRQAQKQELEDLETKLQQLEKDTEALAVSSKQKKEALDLVTKEYRELNRKHNKLTLEHDDAERQVQRLDRDATRQEKQVERLEREISDLRNDRREVVKKMAAV